VSNTKARKTNSGEKIYFQWDFDQDHKKQTSNARKILDQETLNWDSTANLRNQLI
jgi:hypothetical protein